MARTMQYFYVATHGGSHFPFAFSPAPARQSGGGLRALWARQTACVAILVCSSMTAKPLLLAVLVSYRINWSNLGAWTILDARGRPPNVRSSSRPIVRPRSRGSLPRLPLAASVAPPNRNESPNLALFGVGAMSDLRPKSDQQRTWTGLLKAIRPPTHISSLHL